jgi:hypothetical protein
VDFEDLIVGLVAGIALLWQAAVWLKEQLDKQQKMPAPIVVPKSVREPGPAPEDAELSARAIESPAFFRKTVPAAVTLPSAAARGRNLRQQLGLDQRSALQRSIILMTVLGPCRANERGTGNHRS